MGLAAPKSRRNKIAKDPNNTAWGQQYGRKILKSQGWTDGEFLGSKNAAQSEHFTDANASHIRITFRAENLGIGADRASREITNPALGLFSDVLSRLNGGVDDEIQKKQELRARLLDSQHAEHKFGALRFVSGGYLVGDTISNESRAKTAKDLVHTPSKLCSQQTAMKPTPSDVEDNPHTGDLEPRREFSDEQSCKPRRKRKREDSKFITAARSSDNNATQADHNSDHKKIRKEERRQRKAAKKAKFDAMNSGATEDEDQDIPHATRRVSDATPLSNLNPPLVRGAHELNMSSMASVSKKRRLAGLHKGRTHVGSQALKEILMIG